MYEDCLTRTFICQYYIKLDFSMIRSNLTKRNFETEFTFRTSRSSGPGGQNVNKVNSKVELRFNIPLSQFLNDAEKHILFEKLATKINTEGELIIVSQEHRSQLQNKETAIQRFYMLLSTALTPAKKRRPTKPTRGSIERRLEKKKKQASKKSDRRYRAL